MFLAFLILCLPSFKFEIFFFHIWKIVKILQSEVFSYNCNHRLFKAIYTRRFDFSSKKKWLTTSFLVNFLTERFSSIWLRQLENDLKTSNFENLILSWITSKTVLRRRQRISTRRLRLANVKENIDNYSKV